MDRAIRRRLLRNEMNEKTGLLDYLTAQMNYAYLSELRFLSREERNDLIREIDRIPSEDFSLWEWNDALEYLAKGKSKPNTEEAKSELLSMLKRSS